MACVIHSAPPHPGERSSTGHTPADPPPEPSDPALLKDEERRAPIAGLAQGVTPVLSCLLRFVTPWQGDVRGLLRAGKGPSPGAPVGAAPAAVPRRLTSILLYIQGRSSVTLVYTPGLFLWPQPVPQLVTPARYQRLFCSQTRGPPLSPCGEHTHQQSGEGPCAGSWAPDSPLISTSASPTALGPRA